MVVGAGEVKLCECKQVELSGASEEGGGRWLAGLTQCNYWYTVLHSLTSGLHLVWHKEFDPFRSIKLFIFKKKVCRAQGNQHWNLQGLCLYTLYMQAASPGPEYECAFCVCFFKANLDLPSYCLHNLIAYSMQNANIKSRDKGWPATFLSSI